MARGRTSRSYYKQKKAEVKAELTAKTEYFAKLFKNKKITEKWLIEFAEAHADDMPKWIAIVGLTIMVKTIIDKSEEIRSRLKIIRETAMKFPPVVI